MKKQVYMGVHAVLQGMNARVLGKTACQGAALQLETVLLASVKKESNALAKATLLDCLAHAVLLAESPSEDVLSAGAGVAAADERGAASHALLSVRHSEGVHDRL